MRYALNLRSRWIRWCLFSWRWETSDRFLSTRTDTPAELLSTNQNIY